MEQQYLFFAFGSYCDCLDQEPLPVCLVEVPLPAVETVLYAADEVVGVLQ